jgi:predicted MFS family arabinose efflux permease
MMVRLTALLKRHGILLILTLTYVVAFVDRQLLAVLQESIKHDLKLSDTDLGLLSGTSFALFYVAFGIPLARFADRWVRRDVIAISMAIWSVMTALTGFAQNFTHIAVARIGVGIGEAGCNPPGYSMLSDIYSPRHRATAMAVYAMGASFGIMVGFLFGGWLNDAVGWRSAFLLLGTPGIILALIIKLRVPEPVRTGASAPIASFMSGLRFLASRRTLRRMALGVFFAAVAMYGPIVWGASYFIRVHHMSVAQVGAWLALVLGVGGALGQFGAGLLGDYLGRSDQRWYFWQPALVLLLSVPLLAGGFLASSGHLAMLLLCAPMMLSASYASVSLATLSRIAPPDFTATATALFLAIASGGGLGIGAGVIGLISDRLSPIYGADSLRYSLLLVVPLTSVLGAACFYLASRSLSGDLRS